ncbi:MAG: leucyl aminopeptidase [Blastocatellia bacterium]|nr:leucyl aminopeptidase [Blastocatellia bacterium]
MNIHILSDIQQTAADVLIVPVFEFEAATSDGLKAFDEAVSGALSDVLGTDEMHGTAGDLVFLHSAGTLAAKRLLLVGVGEESAFSTRRMRQRVGQAARVAARKGVTSLAVAMRGNLPADAAASAIVEGVMLGLFDPAIYRKKDENAKQVESLTICVNAEAVEAAERGASQGRILAEGTNFSRTLSVEPSNKITPTTLAENAQRMCEANGLSISVLGPEEMRAKGMGALLGVGQGSDEPPRLIVMHYKPENPTSDKRLAFVGKGITFDTGGICIKGRENMWEMKYDMSGGAAVVGAMQAISQLKPGVEVFGVVAAAENMPSGKSYKPGDVLHSYDGQTIEVIDTDAEGRLVLSDAIAYARQDLQATHIVDLATLTGAVMIALGTERAGLMGTDRDLIAAVQAAGDIAGERYWELPLDPDYREQIKSDIADIKNLGGRFAGSITAGYFLREFAHDTPFVHLDIAGTAWLEDEAAEMAKGASGFGVRTIAHVALNMAAQA